MDICFLDLDGCLVDFVSGVLKAHYVKDNPYDREENRGTYYMMDMLGIPKGWFYEAFDDKFWRLLKPTKEMDQILRLVEAKFPSDRIYLLTSPCDHVEQYTHECYSGKVKWVAKWLPQYKRNLHTAKDKFLHAASGRVLIDDCDEHVDLFNKHGGRAFLYPRPWNSRHKESGQALSLLEEFLNE